NDEDATIDQLLMIKQMAWLMRNTAGETSLIVSTGLAAGHLPPESRLAYTKLVGGIENGWKALQLSTEGMQLPPALSNAVLKTYTAYFDPQFLAVRDRLLNALVSGEKPEMTANEWSPYTVGRLQAAIDVADAALDAAKEYVSGQRDAAMRWLAVQL